MQLNATGVLQQINERTTGSSNAFSQLLELSFVLDAKKYYAIKARYAAQY